MVKLFFQRLWLVAKEFAAVAYATRVPTLVVALVVFLLIFTEPAQDMLAEAVVDTFTFGAGASGEATESYWHGRAFAIVISLIILASSAWYWARVVLMFHRSMPDLVANDEGRYRSEWRPHIVLWWPRIVGAAAFFGCAGGLRAAANQHILLGALQPAHLMLIAGWGAFGLGVVFIIILASRRRYLQAKGDPDFNTPWALSDTVDPRAPFQRLRDIRATAAGAPIIARRIGNVFLGLSLLITLILILWAGISPVTLGDFVGGLAIAELAAAIAIPWFTLLTIVSATSRIPWFGLAAVIVVFMPTINGCLSDRIDNHDVRTVDKEKEKGLPDRPTVDQVFEAWLKERHEATKTVYSSRCVTDAMTRAVALGQPLGDERPCREPAAVEACRDGCELFKERPPFIVVAAEGGASRAGYWTALSVGELLRQDPKMRDSIFAISSVSGGSLGAMLIRVLIDLDRVQERAGLPPERRVVCESGEAAPQPYLSCVRVFMRRDFLASAFAGMFYTDLLQRPVPAAWLRFPDRAETIERSWEESWDDVIRSLRDSRPEADALRKAALGLFGRGFVATLGGDAKAFGDGAPIKPWPILLLNGTNVETGRRVITSNVKVVTPALQLTPDKAPKALLPCVATLTSYGQDAQEKQRFQDCSVWEAPAVDDPFTIMQLDIPLSTAVNMSARFPAVEPAGGVNWASSTKRAYHVVDGGIYENFGAQTIKDLLHYILAVRGHKDWPSSHGIRPIVVLLSSDHELDGVRQVAAAYAGTDDRVGGLTTGARLPAIERVMKLGCFQTAGTTVPLCTADFMRYANEVLGDPAALYRTRSGRGESGILSLREQLAQLSFYDEHFFHFRHCMNGDLRPASMTWYVSPISQRFMNELLPSVGHVKHEEQAISLEFTDWMKLVQVSSPTGASYHDPCQNHAELKRLINRYERILNGER